MTNPTIQTNRKFVDPDLASLLNLWKKDVMLSLNCHHIGTVQDFNPDKQTVTVAINYKKTYSQKGLDGVYTTVLRDYPLLLDVPIIIMGGGGSNLTFPIAIGDECLVLFNDRNIDNWFQTGQIQANATARLHSLSDGFALIGVNSMANLISGYDSDRAVLFNGTTKIAVGEDKIEISNTMDSLNTLLQDLCAQLRVLTVVCATPGSPSSVPANAAAIAAIATRIGQLLE